MAELSMECKPHVIVHVRRTTSIFQYCAAEVAFYMGAITLAFEIFPYCRSSRWQGDFVSEYCKVSNLELM